jgi:hypothetical protein
MLAPTSLHFSMIAICSLKRTPSPKVSRWRGGTKALQLGHSLRNWRMSWIVDRDRGAARGRGEGDRVLGGRRGFVNR